jgi:putative ABC transport system permease protein
MAFDVGLEVRLAARSLLRTPGTSALIVLLFAAAVGLTTAVFSFFHAAILRPLPYTDPDRLVFISESHPDRGKNSALRPGNFYDLRKEDSVFSSATARSGFEARFQEDSAPELVPVAMVLEDFLVTLGVSPLLGRAFDASDHEIIYDSYMGPGHGLGRAAILSYGFWWRVFGGDVEAVGREIEIDGSSFTVVGVMPQSFPGLGGDPAVYVPWAMDAKERSNREIHVFYGVGRLRNGMTLESARAQLKALYQRLEEAHPEQNRGWTGDLAPWRDVVLGETKPGLFLLFGGSSLLLWIAGLNVSWLILAKNDSRRREMAIRRALGARSGTLFRQFLVEGLLLVAAGLALSLLLCWSSLRLLSGFHLPTVIPFPIEVELNLSVLAFSLIVSALACAVFGAAPLVARAPGKSGGFLIAAQVALSIVVSTGGALLLRSFAELHRVELGFDPENMITMKMTMPGDRDEDELRPLLRRVEEEVAALPEIRSAATSLYLPLQHIGMNLRFGIEGRPFRNVDQFNASSNVVSPGYFRTVGATLLRGRYFREDDGPASRGVLIVNETLAHEYWPGEDPLGKRLSFPYPDFRGKDFLVVGVVNDVRYERLAVGPERVLYLSRTQAPFSENLIVRAEGTAGSVIGAVRDRVRSIDSSIILSQIATMDEVDSQSLQAPRLRALLFAFYALVSLALAASGLYGLLSRSVSGRTREIGIRMALGASRGSVLSTVAARGLGSTLAGLVIGVAVSIGSAQLLAGLLYGVSPYDPAALGATTLLFAIVALLACLAPARRAVAIDPARALREE